MMRLVSDRFRDRVRRSRIWPVFGRRVAGWLLPAGVTLSLLFGLGVIRMRDAREPEPLPIAPPFPLTAALASDLLDLEERGTKAAAASELDPIPDFDPLLAEPGVEPPALDESSASAEDLTESTLDCVVEPYRVVSIRSPVPGLIEQLHVERSDFVEAGQVLVELESGVERASVELAKARARITAHIKSREARLRLGEKKRERANQLFQRDALSLDLRDEVETEAKVAELELQQAQEDQRLSSLELAQALQILRRRTLRSPITGVVTDRLMSQGEMVDEETVLEIAQLDPLRVEVILPADRFGSVRPGQKAAVVPEVPGDQVHVALVKIVDRVIDAASGTFGVQLELPNPDHAIPGGLHCQVRFLDE